MGQEKQLPVARYKTGPVSGALWEDQNRVQGRMTAVLKATVARAYRDREGKWRSTTSFGREDIPLVIWCLEHAWARMLAPRREQEPPASEEGEVA